MPRHDLSLPRWSRGVRRLLATSALLMSASLGWAQNAVSTLASSATNPAGFAFTSPSGAAVDAAGNVYVTDATRHVIRKITPLGVVTVLAGGGSAGGSASGNADGTGTAATFSSPQGIAIDGAGNLFVADTGNNAIRMVTSAGVVTTLAGTAGPGITVASGYVNATGTAARFNTPLGVATDRSGTGGAATLVFVADTQNNVIRQITVPGGVVTTVAGPVAPTTTSGFVNDTNNNARFSHPDGIVSNAAGTQLYVADTNNHAIRGIAIAGATATVSTLAGSGSAGYTEGTGNTAVFNSPAGVAIGGTGNVIVSDTLNHVIRSVTTGGTTSLFAGGPQISGNINGLATAARFNFPSGVAANSTTTFVVDTNNQSVRVIAAATPPSISAQPQSTTVNAGTTASFSVTASGNPTVSYQWQISTNSGVTWGNLSNGSITGGTISGVTTSQLSITSPTSALSGNQFRVIVSNDGTVDGSGTDVTSSAATLTVNQPPTITNASTAFTVSVGSAISGATITASGSPAPTFAVSSGTFPSWASLNATTGVISGAPTDTIGSPFTFAVTATNTGGSSTPVTFTITVQAGPTISTHPSSTSVQASQTAQFSVAATGSPAIAGYQWQFSTNSGATWSDLVDGTFPGGAVISGAAGASATTLTISNTQAAMNGYQFRVRVSNSVGTVDSNAATLTVGAPPVFTSASTATFVANQTNTFTVTASGSPTPTLAVSGLPSWAQFTPSTGLLTGAPTSTDVSSTPYTLVFSATNAFGAPTQTFLLTVSATPLAPAISSQPSNQSVGLGQSTSFAVTATGSPAPAYQWQRFRTGDSQFANITDDSTYSGTTTATLTISSVSTPMSGDLYRVVVTNINGTATSNSAQLTIGLGSVFTTFAGTAGSSGSTDATGTAARFNAPNGIAVDGSGNVYIADAGNHVVRKITSAGVVSTIAGLAGSPGSADGFQSAARFNTPSGVALDSSGNVYVADAGNHIIRMISPVGVVSTIAGTASSLGNADGQGANARFAFPSGIAVDSAGTIYVADTLNSTVRKLIPGGGTYTIITFVGTSAGLSFPNSVAVDTSFNVYVADTRNHVIRKVTSGGVVSVLAGTIGAAGTADGAGAAARFNSPQGVAVDASGTVYVANTFSHTIRRITSTGDVVTLGGLAGVSGSADGAGSSARFNQPYGIAIDSSGNLYIADTFNHTVRRSGTLTAPGITTDPQNQNVAAGGTISFTVAASGSPSPSFQWQRQPTGTSGFTSLSNDSTYSGVNTSTLVITGVTAAMSGDQFRAVATNLVEPAATSAAATLTVVTPPVFSSASSTTFRSGQANSFTVTATSTPAATFSATGLPSWASLNATSGVLSGTPPDTSGSPFTITLTANNGTGTSTAVTQTFTLTVEPAQVAPVVTNQPATTTVNRGDNATFSVTATGTAPLAYQWRKDGQAINGATSATLTIPNAQAANAGTYTVVVSNAFGSATSNPAGLSVNAPPSFVSQPQAQTVLAGGTVTFQAGVSGGSLSYQWRKNGVAIGGATNSALTLSGVTANDAGNYDVVVTNGQGSVTSSIAQLNVVSSATAPSFTLHPANRTVVAGGNVTLNVAAAGAPAPTYQWRRNGTAIPGATNVFLALANVQAGDAGNYDVVATNSAGTATSQVGALRVIARSYAGTYFGTFSGNAGSFAVYVRDDNSAVFLGSIPGASATLVSTSLTVSDGGQFAFVQSGTAVNGTLGTDGSVGGSVTGSTSASLSGSRSSSAGTTQNVAGFYQAGASSSAAVGYAIANANSQAFAVVQTGAGADGGLGSVNNSGQVTVATGRSTITGTINPGNGTFTLAANGAVTASLSGASELVLSSQRLANISSRARVGTGSAVAIAGFVISGNEAKPVLIRAVGPTLAAFGLTGTLATPKLDLHRVDAGNVLVATNSGIGTGAGRAAIDAAGTAAGAFALGAAGTDAAILTTLSPGNYTATVSSTGTGTGIALIEVYDLSTPTAGQKLFNISTRADAGTGANALVAGVVVTGQVSKRVLIRGVGPGLAAFGLTGTLPAPTLALVNTQSGATVASNTGFNNSNPDSAAITAASAAVGAFPLVTGDSALIVSLPPGNYTAQVSNAAGSTGLAIIEVYELP